MTIAAWFTPALTALFFWGITAFLPKIILRQLQPLVMIIYSSIFFLLCVVVVQLIHWDDFQFNMQGALLAMVTGACGTLGQIFYLEALRRGPVTQVSMISSLYPLVATLLAFIFLHEPLTPRQCCAVLFGLSAIIMLVVSGDSRETEALPSS